MCQHFEAEQNYMASQERREIKAKAKAHLDGTKPLSPEEIQTLAIQDLMLRDMGW